MEQFKEIFLSSNFDPFLAVCYSQVVKAIVLKLILFFNQAIVHAFTNLKSLSLLVLRWEGFQNRSKLFAPTVSLLGAQSVEAGVICRGEPLARHPRGSVLLSLIISGIFYIMTSRFIFCKNFTSISDLYCVK